MCLWSRGNLQRRAAETWRRRRRRRVQEVDYVYRCEFSIYICSRVIGCGMGKWTAPTRERSSGGGDVIGVVQCADARIVTGMLHSSL